MTDVILSADEWEHKVLQMANEKGILAIELGGMPIKQMQLAFAQGNQNHYFTLIDVTPLPPRAGIWRLFRLTDKGAARKRALEILFAH